MSSYKVSSIFDQAGNEYTFLNTDRDGVKVVDTLPAVGDAKKGVVYKQTSDGRFYMLSDDGAEWVAISFPADTALSDTSTNAVQNKVVTAEIGKKQDKLTNTDEEIQIAVTQSHTHANKDELDLVQTGDVAKWDAKQDALDFLTVPNVDDIWNSESGGGGESGDGLSASAIADIFVTTQAYTTGSLAMNNGYLYVAIEDVAAGEWDETKWVKTNIAATIPTKTSQLTNDGNGSSGNVLVNSADITNIVMVDKLPSAPDDHTMYLVRE